MGIFVKSLAAILITIGMTSVHAALPSSPVEKTFQLDMNISVHGQKKSFRVITKDGKSASLSNMTETPNGEINGVYIDVVAKSQATEVKPGERLQIFMQFEVGTLDPAGNKVRLATPQIMAFENEEAEVTTGERTKDGKIINEVSINVLAQQQRE